MKRVKQKHTAPELIVRKELHKRGLRYKIGDRRLPGRPDLSFPRYRVAIFVHGCFWHGHHCRLGKRPSTNIDYWVPKIMANRQRDARKEQALRERGWRVPADVIERWKATGPGWQTRMADRLSKLR